MAVRSSQSPARILAANRSAEHYFYLLERLEAGLQLTGTEVKSVREGQANLRDSYASIQGNQAWLLNCHISPYSPAGRLNHDPLRARRLLLHKSEIRRLMGRTRQKGFTLIPTQLYLKNNLVKCELALARGRKVFDRREALRRRTAEREAEQALRQHREK